MQMSPLAHLYDGKVQVGGLLTTVPRNSLTMVNHYTKTWWNSLAKHTWIWHCTCCLAALG
jgi:hypothetical protein